MIKRRMLSFLMAFVLMATTGTAVYAAENAEEQANEETANQGYQDDLREAKEVLTLLYGSVPFEGTGNVSRAEFVKKLTEVTKTAPNPPETYYFEDVPAFDENAANIYTAAELGWISGGTVFEPTREILQNEALKILLSVMGYGPMAEAQGGFPAGYRKIAASIDMTEDIGTDGDTVSADDATLLVFRALTAPIPKQTIYGEKQRFETGYEDLLSILYNVRHEKGRVTATPYNVLHGSEPENLTEIMEIDGTKYDSTLASWDLLGAGVRAYIRDEGETAARDRVVYLRDLTERRRIDLSDVIDKNGNAVQYWDESGTKKRRISLAADCSFLLNGRKVTENIDSLFVPGCGEIVFAKSERSSEIDTVYINRYSYITVGRTDYVNETVSDRNSYEYLLDFSDALYCIDAEGSVSDYKNLSAGECFRVIKSNDSQLIVLKKVSEKVEGVITRIADDQLYIDGAEYQLSEYCRATALTEWKAGTSVSMICDGDIIVSINASGSSMQYGYWVASAAAGVFGDTVKAKIFTAAGEFKEYILKSKLMIDGVPGKSCKDADAMFAKTPQLIRYGLNGNGEIAFLDFATNEQPEQPGVYPEERNALTCHDYLPQSMRYRNGALMAYVNLASTMIFSVPSDITKEELFLVQNQNALIRDRDYNAKIYNMDDCGMAEAMVYTNDSPYQISRYATPMLIESIEAGLDKDGCEVYVVNGYHESVFKRLYLDKDISVTKKSAAGTVVDSVHPLLSGGDLVSYAADPDGSIKDIKVIFDARIGVFKAERTDNFNVDSANTEMYYGGQVYANATGSKYMTISPEQTANGYDFSPSKLRRISTNTQNIAEYDVRTGSVRPMTAGEIKTYKQNGSDAHFAVVHQDAFATKCIILYTETEERKRD